VSDGSGVAQEFGPGEIGAWRGIWPASAIALVAILVLVNLVTDYSLDVNYGWDARVNCAAVEAHLGGLDPYFVKNLKGTRLSYPYLPVTLDAFRPLCAGGFLVTHYRVLYLALALLCGLLLPGLGRPTTPRDVVLRMLCALGAFVGFEWVAASGNFAIFSGLLTAVALLLLLGGGSSAARDEQTFLPRVAGAAVLGLVMSFKLVFCPVLAALYFLPLQRRRKLVLMAVAAGSFVLPILLSVAFYGDLFASWLSAIAGQIPGQHSVALEETNPSLLLLAREIADHVGLSGSKVAVFGAYGFAAIALVLAPFALHVLRAIGAERPTDAGLLPARLDRWLTDHPRLALRVTVLAMYALYLCSPRLKEYAFFELALYAAVLVVDLRPLALAVWLACGIAVPTLASLTGNAFVDSFGLLAAALVCFWIMLADFSAQLSRR
jgi:hypothetical protein